MIPVFEIASYCEPAPAFGIPKTILFPMFESIFCANDVSFVNKEFVVFAEKILCLLPNQSIIHAHLLLKARNCNTCRGSRFTFIYYKSRV